MKHTPPINKTWLMAGVAAVVVLGGAGLYAMTRSPTEAPAAEGEAGHSEEDGEQGADGADPGREGGGDAGGFHGNAFAWELGWRLYHCGTLANHRPRQHGVKPYAGARA